MYDIMSISIEQPVTLMEIFVLRVVVMSLRDVWRYAIIVCGTLSVMITGVQRRQQLCADSLAGSMGAT